MPFVRRTILAALWGVPGPAFAGVVIAVALQWSAIWRHADGELALLDMATEAAKCWPIPVIEACVGLAYGLMRRSHISFDGNWRSLELLEGFLIGGFVWMLLVSPVLVFGGMACIIVLALVGLPALNPVLLFFALMAVHVFGGAVAGFHVEHYLLRTEKTDETT